MWLRDSSAQVHPYLPLAKRDPALRTLFREFDPDGRMNPGKLVTP